MKPAEASESNRRTPTDIVNGSPVSPDNEALRRIEVLGSLTAQQLRDEWRRLYRGQPPRLSRDLLIRSLAYRLQELAHGGLSKATLRRVASLAREMALKGTVTVATDTHLRPGARLMREWHGKTHTVVVQDDGFAFEGKTYASLTKIAHLITGVHWSGPRFFGLKRTPTTNGDDVVEPSGFAGSSEAAHG